MKKINNNTNKLRELALKRSLNKIKYKKYNDKYINFSSTFNRLYQEDT
jgi:hypothetical protein